MHPNGESPPRTSLDGKGSGFSRVATARVRSAPGPTVVCEAAVMQVHLVDGTYELFRHHFALPSRVNADGLEVAATRGVLMSMLNLLDEGATHVGIATDRTVESFRNELWGGYKTGEDLDPELGDQFPLLDEVLEAAGFSVFSMIEHEADDGMGSAAARASSDSTAR